MDSSRHISKPDQNAKINIRNFKSIEDINFAAELTAAEKWHSETDFEINALFKKTPDGCFLAEIDGEPLGICIATLYEKFAFIGDLIVSPKKRKMGIGKFLMRTAISYINSNKIENIFLDGVRKAVPLYQALGFRHLCRSLRFFGQISAFDSNYVSQITMADLPEISALDHQVFGSDRRFFLESRLKKYSDICLKLVKNNEIQSYLFARYGVGGWITVGPWVSRLQPSDSMILLNSFQNLIGNQPFGLGLLETNNSVIQLLIQEGLMPNPDHSFRMRLGQMGNPGDNPGCFAIGSPAKG
jgi:ribosomal protein S18 acetylase RimI-like enzyme